MKNKLFLELVTGENMKRVKPEANMYEYSFGVERSCVKINDLIDMCKDNVSGEWLLVTPYAINNNSYSRIVICSKNELKLKNDYLEFEDIPTYEDLMPEINQLAFEMVDNGCNVNIPANKYSNTTEHWQLCEDKIREWLISNFDEIWASIKAFGDSFWRSKGYCDLSGTIINGLIWDYENNVF